ncbi:MAG: hypothetical protein CL623_07560 [Arcobacter sp.]|nr:hypothetical protein [Arcobacter sp.]|tara:strand:+ start:10258 stop:11118 length:861 start_codon:yes stop_codon:yes gene_type:complete
MIKEEVLLSIIENKNFQNNKKLLLEVIDKILDEDTSNYKIDRLVFIKNKIIKDDEVVSKEIEIEIIYTYFLLNDLKMFEYFFNHLNTLYLKNMNKAYLYTIKDFEKNHWSIYDVVLDSVRLSAKLIENYEIDNDEIKHWVNIRKKNKELYLAFVISGIIVAHIGGIAINISEYKLMKKGTLNEVDLKNGTYNINNIKYIYIPTIVIEKEFRKPQLLKKLLSSFFEILLKYKNLESIIINVYSLEGKKLSERLGFKFVTSHNDGGKVYILDKSKIDDLKVFNKKLSR